MFVIKNSQFMLMKKILLMLSLIMAVTLVKAENFEQKDFNIDGPQGKLYAILQYPAQVDNNVKYPLVIICHGFTGNCKEQIITILADDIVSDGMAALRFDFNGHGKSEGRFQDMTVLNEIEDLKAVINWAMTQPWVESISLVGHSQGGVVAGMTAGQLGDSIIKSLVLMAPAAVLRDDALRGNTMGAVYDPWNMTADFIELPFSSNGNKILLGKEYIESTLTLPIYETSSKYNGPTLILHGTHDRVVPYSYSERYYKEMKNSTLKLIDGDDHGFSTSMKESCQTVADWFKLVLKPTPPNPIKI